MTQTEKAKSYDEKLARAKECYIDGLSLHQPVKDVLEYIFPEIKESEDERIRKDLIAIFKGQIPFTSEKDAKRYIAWLEKQGEKKLDPRYSILDKLIEADNIYQMSVNDAMIAEARNKAISALSNLEISKLLELEKQNEQKLPVEIKTPEESLGVDSDTYNKIVDECIYGEHKPAWTDEDEENFRDIIGAIHAVAYQTTEDEEARLEWLYAIKQRIGG